MTDLAMTTPTDSTLAALMIRGDTSILTPAQKVEYYTRLCQHLGLDPVTRPFEFVRMQGREVLYATRSCTDQLRLKHGVSITSMTREIVGGVLIVTATGRIGDRTDSAIGALPIEGLRGEAYAVAVMKAETKAKRRLTLSLCGLGVVDESDVDSIPSAQRVATLPDGQPSAVARINARISGSRTLPQRSEAVRDATPASDSPPDSPPEPEAVEAEAWGEVGPETPATDETPATPATSSPPPPPPPPTATAADREREEAAARLREIVESWSGCRAGTRQYGIVARYILQQATGRVVRQATTQDLHAALVWANTHRGTDILAAAMQAQPGGAA